MSYAQELDFATDGLWKVFAERLEQWRVFERRAFRRLAEAQAETRIAAEASGVVVDKREFDYITRVERAERAGYLRNYLFGGLGTEFTRMPYLVQAEFIATIWTVIDKEGLEDEYAGLVGPELLDALRDIHRRYLVMLKARHDRGASSGFNLNARRARLQRRLMLYIAAAVVMADEDDEASVARTRAALAPVDMLRELDAQQAGSIAHEGDEEVETDRFLAELDAIDGLLGASGAGAEAEHVAERANAGGRAGAVVTTHGVGGGALIVMSSYNKTPVFTHFDGRRMKKVGSARESVPGHRPLGSGGVRR
ncbi:hypothetical protein ENSA5_11950 [Enhygromyxa salina]|uniref:Uncharacterized protein n=1 Tax=Enhygromyxa salina TaxID=215803 RepID=A0A2S9YG30_9BACT|nr:hypothetical protein [Enhygromyxa salina]PRQ04012.1 hypothetical protein ENSA5_11950 [Enhygromyxa salina]